MGYPPPQAQTGDEHPVKVKGAVTTIDWMRRAANSAVHRSTPIVAGDFNTRLGCDLDLSEASVPWEFGVGQHHTGTPGPAGLRVREWLEEKQMCVVNTYFPEAGPTYFGMTGRPSVLDYFMIPTTLLPAVKFCKVAWKTGRALQLIPSGSPRDHMPLLMGVDYELRSPPPGEKSLQWDKDRLAIFLQSGKGREVFLQDLQGEFEQQAPKLEELSQHMAPDEHWQHWMKCVREVGERHFAVHARAGDELGRTALQEGRLGLQEGLSVARLRLTPAGFRGVVSALQPGQELGERVEETTWTALRYRVCNLQKQIRTLKRRSDAERKTALVNDLYSELRAGRKAEVQKLARLIAGRGIGVKTRMYNHLPAIRPSAAELRESATSPAQVGGLSGAEVDYARAACRAKAGCLPRAAAARLVEAGAIRV